jgi:hypothetical protein
MTLYRLSQDGLVRRVGHKWFYLPRPGDGRDTSKDPQGLDNFEAAQREARQGAAQGDFFE